VRGGEEGGSIITCTCNTITGISCAPIDSPRQYDWLSDPPLACPLSPP